MDVDDRRARLQMLAEFLRSRRARADPGTVGAGPGTRRRVPGLRREEVAELAHVGVSWYTWLEQARDVHPSPEVLAAIAGALRLDAPERRYLFALAETEDPERPGRATPVDLQAMVNGYGVAPAYVVTTRWDVVAHNAWAVALLGDLGPVGGRPAFREIWARHDVAGPAQRTKRYRTDAGELTFESTTLVVADAPELRLMLLRPIDTTTAARHARLGPGPVTGS